jgi:hypothetical protein
VDASFIGVDRDTGLQIVYASPIEIIIGVRELFGYFKLYFIQEPLGSANLGLKAVF